MLDVIFRNRVANRRALATVLLVLVSSTVGNAAPESDGLQSGYLVNFANGNLKPSVDKLCFGAMVEGHSQIGGTDPGWAKEGGDLRLSVTRPASGVTDIVSAGVFATPVNFGPGSKFEASATFISPDGPSSVGDIWAIGIGARTGDRDDLPSETRVSVTLQVRGTALRFNAPGSGGPGPDLPPEIHAAIFHPSDPVPFTLKLLIDRQTGDSKVSLKVGERVFSRTVRYPQFPVGSNPAITAVGPSVAIANASGKSATVRLREFRMRLPLDAGAKVADCPKT